MAIILRFLLLILFILFVHGTDVHADLSGNLSDEEIVKTGKKKSTTDEDQSCIPENGEKIFKNLKEAEEYLRCILKEREVLVRDFYGVNITAYRYVNIFYRIGYIRWRIMQIDKEIKNTKLEIHKLKNAPLPAFKSKQLYAQNEHIEAKLEIKRK